MSGRGVRFLHASDLHLEQPIRGLDELPDHLREVLVEAPLNAARQVFDVAVLEQVDFVTLAGDVLELERASPAAVAFLVEQFQQLRERGVAVYWAGGEVDPPHAWPAAASLPDNVHVFAADRFEAVTHFAGERPLATLLGRSRGQEPRALPIDPPLSDSESGPQIVVGHGGPPAWSQRGAAGRDGSGREGSGRVGEEAAAAARGAAFWALGGSHRRSTAVGRVHFPGTTLGRGPDEAGPAGVSLVHIDEQGTARIQPIATDSVRWARVQLELGEHPTGAELERLLEERMRGLMTDAGGRVLLVQWRIGGWERWTGRERREELAERLCVRLREQFGRGTPAAWTAGVEFTAPGEVPAAWYQEDTILGDFLRAVRDHLEDAQRELDVSPLLTEPQRSGPLGAKLAIADAQLRRRVLSEAALLGADMLRGDGS